MPERTINTKFWTKTQNNSGGIFDHDAENGIGYAICVEATDKKHAAQRLEEIIESYPASYDCPCCDSRWPTYIWEDGSETPERYGRPLTGGSGIPSYVHFLDGRIEARSEQDTFETNNDIPMWALDKAAQAAGHKSWKHMFEIWHGDGCCWMSIRAHAALIAKHEQPPVDPDLAEARECAALASEELGNGPTLAGWYREGAQDGHRTVRAVLIRLQREKEGTRA